MRKYIDEYNDLTIMSLIEKVIDDEKYVDDNNKVFNIGNFDDFKDNFIQYFSLNKLINFIYDNISKPMNELDNNITK